VTVVLATLFGVAVGIAAVRIVLVSWVATRAIRSSREDLDAIRLAIGSLLDITGVVAYARTRRALEVSDPDSSAIQPFRSSARTVADAYGEAVGDNQHLDV
jgi:hypothetical protein